MEDPLTIRQTDSELVSCMVRACAGDQYLVLGACGLIRVTRAAGCLLRPEVGDTVLVALMSSGKSWLLSVLVKRTEQGSLALPKITSACVKSLSLEAETHVISGEHVTIDARRLHLLGGMLKLQAKALVLKGRQLLQGFSTIRTFADKLAETVVRRTARYDKTRQDVRDLCETNTSRLRVNCAAGLRMRAENVDIKARTHLDIDAEHIKVG